MGVDSHVLEINSGLLTGVIDKEWLLRNEYLAFGNGILKLS